MKHHSGLFSSSSSLLIIWGLTKFWVLQGESHFMDTKSTEQKVVSQEQTRESLIAISECVPDNFFTSKCSSDYSNNVDLIVKDGDEAEKFRSELISISYSQAPENEASLVALENHKN